MSDPTAYSVSVDFEVMPEEKAADTFTTEVSLVAEVLGLLFEEVSNAKPPKVRIRLVEDLKSSVAAVLSEDSSISWSNERIGGQVAAKNLPDPENSEGVLILFDSQLIFHGPEIDIGDPRLNRIFLVTHELVHPLQGRIREQSGALIGVTFPSRTAEQFATSMSRTAVDEYRADVLAAMVLSSIATVDAPEVRAASVADTFALNHLGAMEETVAGMHPTLPDDVDAYRLGRSDLDSMWFKLVSKTDQLLTQLAHTQALLDVLGIPALFELGEIPNLPATRLYLTSLWGPIQSVLRETPVFPSPGELIETEPDVLKTGRDAVFGFWASLGIVPSPISADQVHIRVSAPKR